MAASSPAMAGPFVVSSEKRLTAPKPPVLYSFMKQERPAPDSAVSQAKRPSLKDWPAEDDRLEMFERHILQLTRMNEVGISLIENLDKEAAALVAADKPLPASIPQAVHKLAREIRANRKMMAEINENRRQRITELGIVQH
jgi:hypothetical protein